MSAVRRNNESKTVRIPISDEEALHSDNGYQSDPIDRSTTPLGKNARKNRQNGANDEAIVSGTNAANVNVVETRLSELEKKYTSLLADFQNYRQRTVRFLKEEREKEKRLFAFDLLEVVDNFDRCLGNAPDSMDADWHKGVEAIYDHLLQILNRHDVTLIRAQGEKFDPEIHEAVSVLPDPSEQDGRICEVFQNGYMIGESLLRPAKVCVVKNS